MNIDTLCRNVADRLNTGILVLDREFNITLWNRFLAVHTNKSDENVIGQSIFTVFPELPRKWFERKLASVIELKLQSFCGWEQRHHLFELTHSRPITTDSHFMAQNCSFLPVEENGEVTQVCILIEDVTDVYHYQSQLNKALEKLEQANRIDGLTQVFNRKHWEECLAKEFARARRYQHDLSLIMLDLDNFKQLNDNYGHQGGDTILIESAKIVSQLLRLGDLFGRYGGEEFAIILPDTDLAGAEEVAERIRQKISSADMSYREHKVNVTASIGVATINDFDISYEDMIRGADKALYRAKASGRNQVCVEQQVELAE